MNFRERAAREEREAEERARRQAYEQSPEGRLARLSPLGQAEYERFRRDLGAWDLDWVANVARERGEFVLGDERELRNYGPREETRALAAGFEVALLEACSRFGLTLEVMGSTLREGKRFRVVPAAQEES